MDKKIIKKCIKEYGTPIKLQNQNYIRDSIFNTKKLFKFASKKYNFNKQYKYCYAIKANSYAESVLSALDYTNGLECSSLNELVIINYLIDNNLIPKDRLIIINGFKTNEYYEFANKFINYVDVIFNVDNWEEFESINKLDKRIKIGVRVSDIKDSRFGFNENELIQIAQKLKNGPYKFTTLQFHICNCKSKEIIFDVLNKKINLYTKLKQINSDLNDIDVGGFSAINKFIEMSEFVDSLVKMITETCFVANVQIPNIIQEIGDKTVSDSECVVYKVGNSKWVNNKLWYILDGSIICDVPDYWSNIMPNLQISYLSKRNKKLVEVNLGGCTCDDCDVVKNIQLPQFDKKDDLYIVIENIGGYQDMLQSKLIRHCLIDDTEKVFIKSDNELYLFDKDNSSLLNGLHYNKKFLNFLKKGEKEMNCKELIDLKAGLMCYGVNVDTKTGQELVKQRPYFFDKGFVHAINTKIANSNICVSVAEKFSSESPYTLIEEKGNFYIVYSNKKIKIELFDDLPKTNTIVDAIARPHSNSVISLWPSLVCCFATPSGKCKFCSLKPCEEYSFVKAEEVVKGLEKLFKLTDKYQINLGGGIYKSTNAMADYLIKIIKGIRKFTNNGISVELAPPSDINKIEELKKAGASSLIINLEIANDELRAKIAPNKHKISYEYYYECFKKGIEIFGKGRISSVLIVGIQPVDDIVKECEKMTDLGVIPTLIPFKPMDDCELHYISNCSKESLLYVSSKLGKMLKEKGLDPNLQEGCTKCGGCSLETNYFEIS